MSELKFKIEPFLLCFASNLIIFGNGNLIFRPVLVLKLLLIYFEKILKIILLIRKRNKFLLLC